MTTTELLWTARIIASEAALEYAKGKLQPTEHTARVIDQEIVVFAGPGLAQAVEEAIQGLESKEADEAVNKVWESRFKIAGIRAAKRILGEEVFS